jgi:MFS family permease
MARTDEAGETVGGGDFWLRLALISAGVGLHAFNEFAVVAALPRAAVAFGAEGLVGLVSALYAIGAVGGGMTGVVLRRTFGVRAAMLGGVFAFVAGAAISMSAGSMGWLCLGRGLGGLSDGLIVAVCYGLIPELFRPALVPKVFAAEAVVWALAGIFGPVVGGGLTEWFGWRAAMLSAVPVLALFAAVCLRTLPTEKGDRAALSGLWRLWPVAVALAGAASISAPAAAPDPVAAALSLVIGVALLVAAFGLDAHQANPVFPRRSFRFDAVGLGMWVLAAVSFAHYLAQPYVALGLQEQFRLSATWVGAGSVVLALSWSGAAILTAGPRFDRWRPAFTFGGPATVMVGEGLTAFGMAQDRFVAVIAGQAIIGVGFALLWGPVTQAVMAAAPEAERDRAGGIMPTIASLGSAVGAGAGGVLALSSDLPSALQHPGGGGPATLQWGLAAACALVAVIAGLGQYRAQRQPDGPRRHLTLPTPSAK